MWDEEIARLPKERQQDAQIAVILGWEMLWSDGQNLMAYAPSEIAAAGIEAERMPVPEFTRMLAEYDTLRLRVGELEGRVLMDSVQAQKERRNDDEQ